MKASTAAAALCLLVPLGCSRKGAGGPSRVPVTVARAEQRAVPYEIVATGTVEPRQAVAVQSQVTGVVTRVAFREGDEVAVGDVLFRIDDRPFQAALNQAQAALARDAAQAQNAALEAQRYAELVKQDYVTKSDYDAKRATAEPLVVINQIRPILVRFPVPERSLPDIQRHRSNRLPVRVSPSKEDTTASEGLLTFVDNAVDTTTGTVLLKGEFPNRDNALWPGEFLSVRLQLYVDSSALVVPSQAVMTGQQGTYVFVLNQDGTARSQPVTVQRTAGAYAVISQGVQAGDEVVTDGQVRLVSGAPVEVKGVADPAREVEADK